MPADLQEKILKFEHQHVVLFGQMECTMYYSPWTASCEMTIGQMEMAK